MSEGPSTGQFALRALFVVVSGLCVYLAIGRLVETRLLHIYLGFAVVTLAIVGIIAWSGRKS